MSSSQSPDKQDDSTEADLTEADPTGEESPEGAPARESSETAASEMDTSEMDTSEMGTSKASASEAVIETAQCLNCGRRFVGDYCPDCGQKANKELSAFDIVGDFFRELVDTERGFWHTVKGLTLRPGTTVRRYLRGERQSFMSPGRYLLVSAVIAGAVIQILQWIAPSTSQQGVIEAFAIGFTDGLADSSGEAEEILPSDSAIDEAVRHAQQLGPARVLTLVALAGLAGLLYQVLFRRNVGSLGESFALAAYAVGHGVILMSGARFVLRVIDDQYGIDVSLLGPIAFLALLLVYPGTVTYGCFGASWWNGLKGTLGTLWALVEVVLVVMVSIGGYAGWLLWAYPETYSGSEPVVDALTAGGICLLLLHGPAFFLRIFRGRNSQR